MEEFLLELLPVLGTVRLVLSYAVEPIEWWKILPTTEERLQFARSQGFTVTLGNSVLLRQLESNWRLNSTDALFGCTDVAFEFGDWKCTAEHRLTSWFKKKKQHESIWTAEWMLHRDDDLPAQIAVTGYTDAVQLAWYRNGLQHREDNKPSFVGPRLQLWCVDNKHHRSDGGPAQIYSDGEVAYYLRGERVHRRGGHDARGIPDHVYNCPFYVGREEMHAWLKSEASLARWYNGPPRGPPGGAPLA